MSSVSLGMACGDDGGGKSTPDAGVVADAAIMPSDAAVPLTIDDICDADEGLFIDFFNSALGCFPEFELIFGTLPGDGEFSDACYGQFANYVAEGSIVLGTRDDLAVCQAVISGIDCQIFEFDAPNECTGLFAGTLATGQDCDVADQCAGDSFCDTSGGGDCGVCAPRKADQASCTRDQECSSRHCSFDQEGDTCRRFGQIDDACRQDEDCAGRLECGDLSLCEAARVWAATDACVSNDNGDCGFPLTDLLCDEGNAVCIQYLAFGAACGGPSPCNFLKYETCDVGGSDTCVAPTIRGLNEPCSFFTGDKCAVGLQCSNPGDGGTCLQPPQVGDSCTAGGGECGDFLLECVGSACQYGSYTGICPAS